MVYGEQFMKAINYPDSDVRLRGLQCIDDRLETLLYCCDVRDFHVFENESNRWHPEPGSGGRLYVFSRLATPRVCAYLISGQQCVYGSLLMRLGLTPDLEYLALQDHAYFTYGNRDRFELRLKLPHEVHVLGRIIQLVHKYEAYQFFSGAKQDIDAILRFGRAAMRFCFMHNPSTFMITDKDEKADGSFGGTKNRKNLSDVQKNLLQESAMTRSMLKRKPDWQNEFYRKNFYIVGNCAAKRIEERQALKKQESLFDFPTKKDFNITTKQYFTDSKEDIDRNMKDSLSSLFGKTPQKRLFEEAINGENSVKNLLEPSKS